MKNLYNYLEKNKNISLKEKPWNVMDNLLCACISYIPVINTFSFKTFNELCEEVINYKYPSNPEYVSYTDKKIFTILKDSLRYKDMCFLNFVNIIDDNTQFGAITIKIGNKKIISFKGSDGSMIGWIENLRLLYKYPTYTHLLAIDYLRNNIHMFDYDVTVLGHSKGGNLALTSVMELPWYKKVGVKKIYNFDGPGLKKEEFASPKYKSITKKINNYVPNKSYVGVLMYNDNMKVVDTNALMIGVHYPTNWKIENDEFIYDDLSSLSNNLHKMTTDGLKDMDQKILEHVFEEIFKVFEKRKKEHVGITIKDIHNIIKSLNNVPKKEKEYVSSLIKSMFDLANNK